MRKNLINVFLVTAGITVLLMMSCSPSKKDLSKLKVPSEIITPDSMVVLIAELQIAEATLREFKRLGRETEIRNVKMIEQVFDSLSVSPERYEQSLRYYEQHLELYQEIYGEAIAYLTQRQTEILEEKKDEAKD